MTIENMILNVVFSGFLLSLFVVFFSVFIKK